VIGADTDLLQSILKQWKPATADRSRLPVLHLVSCGSLKLTHAAPARDIYCSTRFKLTSAIVEHEPWAILSAKHGLLWPDTVIEPYDESLVDMTERERHAWAQSLLAQIPAADRYVIWAGRLYADPLATVLNADLPMHGLSMGRQLAYLKKHQPAPSLLTSASAALDLLIRCDPELLPAGAKEATDKDWDKVRTMLQRSIAAASTNA
jgi:hypothetical protein